LLPTRGADAFRHFVDALRDDYDWIAEDLENEKDVQDCAKDIYDANSVSRFIGGPLRLFNMFAL
jgi:hypothetical protein